MLTALDIFFSLSFTVLINIVKLLFYGFAFFGIILSRYFLVAGGSYFVFYWWLRKSSAQRKSIIRDIKLSVLSAVVFALYAALIMSEYDMGVTLLYTSLDKYGLWYLGFSFVALLVLQDACFYLVHRLFHHPLLFRWLHFGHHRSGEPTPWTSFAFDLPEALVQGLFFACVVFIIPLHFITLAAALMTMTIWAVLNHLGFRLFPSSLPCHWLGRWFIGPTHHLWHHRKYTVHYGLYFTLWDKLLGTDDPNYEQGESFRNKKNKEDKGAILSN